MIFSGCVCVPTSCCLCMMDSFQDMWSVSILFALGSLLDAESMCWAKVVSSGCGGRALICSKSTLSFQGVGCCHSRAFTRSPSNPLETCAWSGCEKLIVSFSYLNMNLKIKFSLESGSEHEWGYAWSFRLWAEVSFPFNTLQKARVGLSLHDEDVSLASTRSPSIPFKHTLVESFVYLFRMWGLVSFSCYLKPKEHPWSWVTACVRLKFYAMIPWSWDRALG